jgi:hypothetical protein
VSARGAFETLADVRGFLIGLILVSGLTVTILSLRPGGLRQQLRFAARRFRIALVIGGVYVLGSIVIRIAFPSGPGADYGPGVLAVALAGLFLYAGRDPVIRHEGPSHSFAARNPKR